MTKPVKVQFLPFSAFSTPSMMSTGNRIVLLAVGGISGILKVGKEFNVTRERIRQIEAKALRKLRHPSRSRKLKDYLD